MLLALFLSIIVLSLAMLAVDVGKLAYERNRLQLVADAAALQGATGVVDGDWQARIETSIADNTTATFTPTLAASGAQSGWWDGVPRTFSTGSRTAFTQTQAVKVDVETEVGFLFAPFIGVQSFGITATATAVPALAPDRQHNYYAMLGRRGIEADGTADFDSYNSFERKTFPGSNGAGDRDFMGGTNGSVKLKNGAEIWGDFFSSPNSNANINNNMFRSGGEQKEIDYEIEFDDPVIPSNAINLGNISVNSGNHTYPGGTYIVDSLNLGRDSHITFTGPVQVYLRGDAQLSGRITTYDNFPENLRIVQTSAADVLVDAPHSTSNEHVILADIYNPYGVVQLDGKVDFYGRLWGDEIKLTKSSDFFGDTNLTRRVTDEYKSGRLVD